MTVLLLDKQRVKRSFAAAATSYDSVAELQRRVGLELLRRFPPASDVQTLLDLGSGTGFLSGEIAASGFSGQLLAADLAMPMLEVSRQKHFHVPIQHVCADAERLPFPGGSLDRVYSNLAFQWLENLPRLFGELRRVIRDDGQLVFSTFGPCTLQELKAAWAGVDDAVHVNQFPAVEVVTMALQAQGFTEIEVNSLLYRCSYPSVLGLMQELKGLGAHNVNRGRKHRPTTRSQMRMMMERYQQAMTDSRIVASYEVFLLKAAPC